MHSGMTPWARPRVMCRLTMMLWQKSSGYTERRLDYRTYLLARKVVHRRAGRAQERRRHVEYMYTSARTAKDSRRSVAIRAPQNDLKTSYSPGEGAR